MIIDVHTHPPRHRAPVANSVALVAPAWRPDKTVDIRTTWADYELAMEGVDRAIAFNIATYPETPSGEPRSAYDTIFGPALEINNAVAEFAREHDGRVIGFMSVHPDDPNALKEMDRCVYDLGLRGLKLGMNYQRADLLGRKIGRAHV